MFYGLNKFIKKLLPKQLFYRGLLIVATPIIILQITILIVFFDSLWIKANKGMTRSLVSEIVTIIDIYNNENEENKKIITDLYNKNFNFSVRFLEDATLPNIRGERWFSPMDRTLRRELKSQFIEHWFDTTSYKEVIDLRIKFNNGVLQIFFPKDRVTPSSARIFALWITLPAFLLILIAILFLRNQTRPIVNLAKAAEQFGKGDYIEKFRPSGALEIRQAGHEFDRMRKRITRHLNQRSEMLSGISHDLRTPLTRLKLQLSFLKDKPGWVSLDENYNGLVDENELKFFSSKDNNIYIPVTIYSNRLKVTNKKVRMHSQFDIETANTKFNIITENNIIPKSIKKSTDEILGATKVAEAFKENEIQIKRDIRTDRFLKEDKKKEWIEKI